MNSFVHTEMSCVSVFRSESCSHTIRQRLRRRTVTFDFNYHLNSQIHVCISRTVHLDLLSPLRGTPLLPRSKLSSSELWIQISLYDSLSAPPIPSNFFSRHGRQRNHCPRRLSFCQRVVFEIVLQLWVSQQDTVLHASMERSRKFSRFTYSLGQMLRRFCKV